MRLVLVSVIVMEGLIMIVVIILAADHAFETESTLVVVCINTAGGVLLSLKHYK